MRRAVLPCPVAFGLVAAACSSDDDAIAPLTAGGATQDGSTRDAGARDGSTPAADASGASDAASDSASPAPDAAAAPLTVTSAAFAHGAFIPKVHSCDGAGQSTRFGPLAGSGNEWRPPGTPHDYEVSVYAFSVPALPQAALSMGPSEVDALVRAHTTAAGNILGKYARE